MELRLKYTHLSPEGFERLRAVEHFLNSQAGLETNLLEFVRVLASKLNGCEYCIELHTAELVRHNETPERIANVTSWRTSDLYTQRERAALAWAESVTNIQNGHAPNPAYEALKSHFTDVEISNLTLAIATINAWNRMAISLGAYSHRG